MAYRPYQEYLLGYLQFTVLALTLFPGYSYGIMSAPPIRRQATVAPAPGFLSEDLLPPPALSASFPTLRPRRNRPGPPPPSQPISPQSPPPFAPGGLQQPSRDLVPPFLPAAQRPIPFIQNNGPRAPPQTGAAPAPAPSESYPLLPPIEIPPERPLTDSEILATLPPKESSFIPTTGQGLSTIAASISIPVPAAPAQEPTATTKPIGLIPVLAVAPTPNNNDIGSGSSTNSSSVVRFPTDSELAGQQQPVSGSSPTQTCPVCECTNEVDYICASNGVLYLNSCSFDCATFCQAGLKRADLSFCASKNQS